MAKGLEIESILAADCGSTMTKVILIDTIDGQYRFVAQGQALSTIEPPQADVLLGVRHAIGQIEEATGRLLLDEQGQLITPEEAGGSGVDAFVATTSAAAPLRLILAGLTRDVSIESARRAISSAYALAGDTISLDDGAQRGRRSAEARIRILQRHQPDAVFIVGGTDGGAAAPVADIAEVVALACSIMDSASRPQIVFAGNKEARPLVAEILGSKAELHAVNNVRPALDVEDLTAAQEEINRVYQERKMARIPGFGGLSAWSPVPILPTTRAFGYLIKYLARQYGLNVAGVDIGGATATVAGVIDGHFTSVSRSDLGLSHNIGRVSTEAGFENILRWLPFGMDVAEARNIIANKQLRPTTVPQTRRELLLEQAIAREALRLTLAEARQRWLGRPSAPYPGLSPFLDLIVGSGGVLAHAAHYGQAALILLDVLQPIGVSSLALDVTSMSAPLGVTATVEPLAAAQVMERDGFLSLGTVVAPVGTAREGETALQLKITYDDGRALEMEMPYGSLEVLPLAPGHKATLELRPTRRFDTGLGKGKGATTELEGGAVGVIIDTRGRPLSLPVTREEQQAKIQEWLWGVGS
ncbi:MAG: glutamate mutase L [Anaerolineae bacterium]